jgi:hypothetical protein
MRSGILTRGSGVRGGGFTVVGERDVGPTTGDVSLDVGDFPAWQPASRARATTPHPLTAWKRFLGRYFEDRVRLELFPFNHESETTTVGASLEGLSDSIRLSFLNQVEPGPTVVAVLGDLRRPVR